MSERVIVKERVTNLFLLFLLFAGFIFSGTSPGSCSVFDRIP